MAARRNESIVYGLVRPGMTYTLGPHQSDTIPKELGLFELWQKGVAPEWGQRGRILATTPHPGGDPKEIVAAFQFSGSRSVVFLDQRALVIAEWRRQSHHLCPPETKQIVHTVLLCAGRLRADDNRKASKVPLLPSEMWEMILSLVRWKLVDPDRMSCI
eukprot:m.93465 g.93465  ORF g.93465 m.93465 type:complete len:159 (-) comp12147_c0_seq1:365-841(-)